MLHFGSSKVKEFTIVRGVRGEINNTDKFGKRVTSKLTPDGGKFGTVKSVGTEQAMSLLHRCIIQI